MNKDFKTDEMVEIGKRIVGTLANDIRNYWGDNVWGRYYIINDVLRKIGYPNARALGVSFSEACEDGRYFRDWEGPYGGTVSEDELELFGVCPDDYYEFNDFNSCLF